jgi:conjugal transfer pilus assembly protein TraU
MKKFIVAISLLANHLFAVCNATPSNIVSELMAVDYSAIMPIRIAGIPVAPGRMPDAINQVNFPICFCPAPPPIMIRMGITIGLYNPSRLIDAVKDSYCFEGLGVNMPIAFGNNGQQANDAEEEHTFFQTHMSVFSVFQLLDLGLDIICLQTPSVSDIAYMTEVDPLWNDDALSALIQPEALLFGNPITNLACIADSVSSMIDWSNPALFWCKGSWGNAYPMTGRVVSNDLVQSSASAASELIYKLHRQLMMWATWGYPALCTKYPLPIWEKDAYRMQILEPIPHPLAGAIGKTGLMWSWGKNVPMAGDNFSYGLFIKRDCCAF